MATPEELYNIHPVPYVARTEEQLSPEALYEAVEEGPSLTEAMLEEAPQAVGGITGGITGAITGAPAGPLGILVGGAAGAWVGGAAGKGYQNIYNELFGDKKKAPRTSYEAAIDVTAAGNEEAAWDIGGALITKGLMKGFHLVRPKAVDDIEKIAIGLEKSGGQLTAAQRTDSWLIHQLDSLTRGSITGSGRMNAIDVLNESALKNLESELSTKIAKNTTEHLSDPELGQLFLNTIKGGKGIHRTVVGEMYSGFDELVPSKSMRDAVTLIETKTHPVSTSKLKESLAPFKEMMERTKYTGESAEAKKLLDSVFAQDKTLSFSDAQHLRSSFLDAQRNLENTVGKSKISSKVNRVVDELTKAMDDAAEAQSPAILAKYRAIKNYANKGFKAMDNKFIADLVVANKKNPEAIGEHIFRKGNVQEIFQAKKALKEASKHILKDKAKYGSVTFDDTWNKMQSGYLESILTGAGRQADITAGATLETVAKEGMDVSGQKLLKLFTDRKSSRTLLAAFDREQRDGILHFAKTAERVQRKPSGSLGMLMQLTQGGAAIALVKGMATLAEAGTLFVAPNVLARVMTSPKGARLMSTALETPLDATKSGAVLGQLTAYIHDVQKEMEEQ